MYEFAYSAKNNILQIINELRYLIYGTFVWVLYITTFIINN